MTAPRPTRREAENATSTGTIAGTVHAFLERHVGPGPFIVAVSGGLDSSVLLDAIAQCAPSAVIAHVNHGLRGENADRDEGCVRRESARHGLPFACTHVDLEPSAGGLAGRARTARYAALAAIALRHGARWILTAHHADDQVETVFARIIGGAGLDGLGGMHATAPCPGARQLQLGRPLLPLRRTAIHAYARAREVPFVHDETNERLEAQRNRLRHVILPLLSSIDPSLETRLLRTAAIARAGTERMHEAVAAALERLIARETRGEIGLDRTAFRHTDPVVRPWLLREAARRLSPGRPPVPGRGALASLLAAASGSRTAPDGWRVRRGLYARTDARTLTLATRPFARPGPERTLTALRPDGSVTTPDGRVFTLDERIRPGDAAPAATPRTELLDARRWTSVAGAPIILLRRVSPTDTIRPLGRRSVSRVVDYLKKRGVPAIARRNTIVAIAEPEDERVAVVWGHTIEHALRVTPETERVWRLRELPPPLA